MRNRSALAPASGAPLCAAFAVACSLGCGFRTALEVDAPSAACVDVAPGVETATLDVVFTARIGEGDVALLVDLTGSMDDEMDHIRLGLRDTIVPGIRGAIAHARFAVAGFADYPVDPYGLVDGDVPFVMEQTSTTDIDLVEAATDRLAAASYWGGDPPESQIPALFHLVDGSAGPFVGAADCRAGERGHACFSDAAAPIVLLFTDAPFHGGPESAAPYVNVEPAPPTYEETLTALSAIGARVVVIYSGLPADAGDARRLAADTGAIDAAGEPLVLTISQRGEGLDDAVVRAVEQLVAESALEVDAVVLDVPGDAFDAPSLVRSVSAVRVEPSENARAIGDHFAEVRPGARLAFQIELDVHALPIPSAVPMRIAFRDREAVTLGEMAAWVVVDGGGDIRCPSP